MIPTPELLTDLVSRIAPSTVVFAVLAAGGMLMTFMGLTSTTRIDLQAEVSRATGVRESSMLERAQKRLHLAGIYVSIFEVIGVGLAAGAGVCAVLLLTGFGWPSLIALVAGIPTYAVLLAAARDREIARFRAALPDAIDDLADLIKARGGALHDVMGQMAGRGPRETRAVFAEIVRASQGQARLEHAMLAVARERGDQHLTDVMRVLADHYTRGNPKLHETLPRIAKSQRDMTAQAAQIHAAQAGGRVVATIYGLAPALFLMLFKASSAEYARFYSEGVGQLVQALVFASGVLSWWLARKVASRGLSTDGMGDTQARRAWRRPVAPTATSAPGATGADMSRPPPGPSPRGGRSAPSDTDPSPGPSPWRSVGTAGAPSPAPTATRTAFARAQTAARYQDKPVLAKVAALTERMVSVFVDGRVEQHTASPLQVRNRQVPANAPRFRTEGDGGHDA